MVLWKKDMAGTVGGDKSGAETTSPVERLTAQGKGGFGKLWIATAKVQALCDTDLIDQKYFVVQVTKRLMSNNLYNEDGGRMHRRWLMGLQFPYRRV